MLTDMPDRETPEALARAWLDSMRRDEPLLALSATRALRKRLGDAEAQLVSEALGHGAAWEDVAAALGISRQAAWRKFHEKPRRRDERARRRRERSPDEREAQRRHREERRELRDRQRRELGEV
jgi:hypothetical protein